MYTIHIGGRGRVLAEVMSVLALMPPKMEDTRKVWDVVSAALVRVPAAEIDAKAVCQMLNAVNALARTQHAVTESQIRTHALEAAKSGVFGHGIAQGGPGYGGGGGAWPLEDVGVVVDLVCALARTGAGDTALFRRVLLHLQGLLDSGKTPASSADGSGLYVCICIYVHLYVYMNVCVCVCVCV